MLENRWFGFTGRSVSSDSIRACSHKVLSPPISHATSLPAQCRRSSAWCREEARAGRFGFDKTARATDADGAAHAMLPCSHRHAIKKWLVSSTNRKKGKKWRRRKQKVFCSSDRRKTNVAELVNGQQNDVQDQLASNGRPSRLSWNGARVG